MADGFVLAGSHLIPVFIYEGEKLAVEYPSGQTFDIPEESVHLVTHSAKLPNGEPCQVLNLLTPITRLPIVVTSE